MHTLISTKSLKLRNLIKKIYAANSLLPLNRKQHQVAQPLVRLETKIRAVSSLLLHNRRRRKVALPIRNQATQKNESRRTHAHLSLEQAERIAVFFGLSEEETHYFLVLIQYDRVGTESLKRYFSKQTKALLNKRTQLKNRVESGAELPADAQMIFFSSWIYPAIHLLTRMPQFSKPDAIARRLDLPVNVVEGVLQFLESAGLVQRPRGTIQAGPTRMHLPHDSPLIGKHHINWRMRSIRDLEQMREESLHYSSVVTLSKKDVVALKETLMKTVESAKQAIQDSPDEVLYSLCLDFFEV